jgi:hypothetical protein
MTVLHLSIVRVAGQTHGTQTLNPEPQNPKPETIDGTQPALNQCHCLTAGYQTSAPPAIRQ